MDPRQPTGLNAAALLPAAATAASARASVRTAVLSKQNKQTRKETVVTKDNTCAVELHRSSDRAAVTDYLPRLESSFDV